MLVPALTLDGTNSVDLNYRSIVDAMQDIDFSAVSLGKHHSYRTPYIPKDLLSCSHVWIRVDRVLRPLEAPYEGPFKIVKRFDKTFAIERLNGKHDVIAIDRLKPVIFPKNSCKLQPVTNEDVSLESLPGALNVDIPVSTENDVVPFVHDADSAQPEPVVVTRRLPGKRQLRFNKNSDFHYY